MGEMAGSALPDAPPGAENKIMTRFRVYISGPMTGLPDNNYPAFFRAAAYLQSLGHDAVNPAALNHGRDGGRHEIMRRDIEALLTCDVIYLLEGWEDSRGARLEYKIACEIGLTVWTHQAAFSCNVPCERQRTSSPVRKFLM
jgi:hypothetical protein